ncbi:MAG: hypothetical protein ABFD92_03830 [Planctomycetaceae bacterium]|nr:hypothetical protein [Planctomycetaceae bacterium]
MARIPMTKGNIPGMFDTVTKKWTPTEVESGLEVAGPAAAGESHDKTLAPPRLHFEWKGGVRYILTSTNDEILSNAPNGSKWLVEALLKLVGLPHVPPYGYLANFGKEALREKARYTAQTFGPLGNIQRWCQRNSLFDLSAIIVNMHEPRVPGRGYYVSDTRDCDEWRKYMCLAIETLKQARSKGHLPPM